MSCATAHIFRAMRSTKNVAPAAGLFARCELSVGWPGILAAATVGKFARRELARFEKEKKKYE